MRDVSAILWSGKRRFPEEADGKEVSQHPRPQIFIDGCVVTHELFHWK